MLDAYKDKGEEAYVEVQGHQIEAAPFSLSPTLLHPPKPRSRRAVGLDQKLGYRTYASNVTSVYTRESFV